VIEIDPQYVDVAIRRWESYTGKQARLANSDATFESVNETRSAEFSPEGREEASANV
jgi:hypothetical protein